jgi:hypothetical protein
MSSFLFQQSPIPIVASSGTQLSLSSILTSTFGPNWGGYSQFWVANYTAAFLSAHDSNYWDPAHPSLSEWLINGAPIPDSASGFNQQLVTPAQVPTCTLQVGNNIGPFVFLTVPISNGSGSEYIQYEINVVAPGLVGTPHGPAGEPTAVDIVAAAQRYDAAYDGVLNDNDCGTIASDLAAAAGAPLDDIESESLDPTKNQSAGFWRVVYRGSDPNPVSNWQTLVQPGDIVRMGWAAGGMHTTTVLSVNGDGSITVFDNADRNASNQEDIGIHTVNYDTLTTATTVTIFRLSNDGLYLINGSAAAEILNGTPQYNNEIVTGGGNDIVNCGPRNDVVQVSPGSTVQINGGGGYDTVVLPVALAGAQVTDSSAHALSVSGGAIVDPGGEDIAIAWSGGLAILRQIGSVQFTDQQLAVKILTSPDDFNGDGVSDALWRNTAGEVDTWLVNNGHVSGGAAVGTLSSAWRLAGAGDLTGTGASDLVWQNTSSGEVDSWLMANGHLSGGSAIGHASSVWQPLGIGDFNADHVGDLLWRNSSTGEVDTWLMNNGHVGGGSPVGFAASAWQFAGVGDFNNDGTSDVVWHNTTTGEVDTWLIANGQLAGGAAIGHASSAWQCLGAGDFNGDGTSDLLWRNTTTGEVDTWIINNGQVTGGTALGSVSSAWQFAGIGYLTSTRTSDVLWRNVNTGEVDTWLITNDRLTGGTAIGTASSAWQPQVIHTA